MKGKSKNINFNDQKVIKKKDKNCIFKFYIVSYNMKFIKSYSCIKSNLF